MIYVYMDVCSYAFSLNKPCEKVLGLLAWVHRAQANPVSPLQAPPEGGERDGKATKLPGWQGFSRSRGLKSISTLFPCPSPSPSLSLSPYLSIYLSLSACLSIYVSACLSIYVSACLSIYLSIYRLVHLAVHPSSRLSIHPSVHPSMYQAMYPSIYPSIRSSVCRSLFTHSHILTCTCTSIHVCAYMCTY